MNQLITKGLEQQYDRYQRNIKNPNLQQLFLEVTQRCNLSCVFCGSRCDEHLVLDEVPLNEYKKLLDKVKEDFGTNVFIVLTGGEPFLRKDLFELCEYIHKLGFSWGMTTNATLIDKEKAQKLCDCGIYSIAVSLDGTKEIHDNLRQVKDSYEAAIRGIEALSSCENKPDLMVTSVLNHNTIDQIDVLWNIVKELPIDSWRVINVEPVGSAKDKDNLLFTKEDFIKLFDFIEEKRRDNWPVTYGCCHYLFNKEGLLRNWFYLCNAGIHVASIMSNGDIASCLDIERRPETIFGNIYKDDFTKVWYNEFKIYREGLFNKSEKCKNCEDLKYCRGDSVHSWDFNNNEPLICMKEVFKDEKNI